MPRPAHSWYALLVHRFLTGWTITSTSAHTKLMLMKMRGNAAFNARVLEIEQGNFTPVVDSRNSRKTGQRYLTTNFDVMGFIRKLVRCDLLKTTREERGRRVGPADDIANLDINLERESLIWVIWGFGNIWMKLTLILIAIYQNPILVMVICMSYFSIQPRVFQI